MIFLQYYLGQSLRPDFQGSAAPAAEMRKNMAGMQRVYEVLDTPIDIKDAPTHLHGSRAAPRWSSTMSAFPMETARRC